MCPSSDLPAGEAGRLSSLLNNHPGYRLSLLREIDPSLIELDLAGPGPDYLCQNVIDTMRKDGRVLSIQVHSLKARDSFVATPRPVQKATVGAAVAS